MATYYMDVNGSTLGFGTLDTITSNNQILTSTSALGNINTAAITFSSATTTNILSFGSLSTSANTTPGTLSTNSIGQQLAFNGLIFQGLTGTQTITYQGTTNGTLLLNGTSPFIEVTATGVLDIIRGVQGTTNWEKRGATTLRLRGVNTFSGGMTISAGTVEVGSATALGNTAGTVTMTGGKLASWTTGQWSFANPLALNGTMTLGDTLNNGDLTFTGTTSISGVTALTTASNLFLTGVVSGANAWSKAGSAILRLTNANTFSQGLSISAGTVEISNVSALGSGTVTMTGGKLSSSSTPSYFVSNAFSVSGTVSFLDATNTGYIATSGAFNIAAPATVTLNAAQQLYVSGALNSTNNAATLSLNAVSGSSYRFVGAQGTFNSQITLNSNAVVQLAEYTSGTPNQLNGATAVTLNSGSRLTYYGSTGTTVPYSLSGAGILTVVNPQTTTFSNTVSQSGPFEMVAGNGFLVNQAQKVVLSNASSVGAASYYALYSDAGATYTNLTQTIEYTGTGTATNSKIIYIDHTSNNGGTFIYRNNSSNNSTLNHTGQIRHNKPTLAETFDINAANGPMTFSSTGDAIFEASTGVLSVKKTGTYAASINGTGNYRGTVQVTEGTLNANSATALGATSGGAISVTSGATLSLGTAPTYASRSLTISGTGVSSTVGALVIANANTSQFQSITLGASGTYIRATNSGSINAPFTSNNNSIVFGASAGSNFIPFASLSNVFSGTGSVTYGSHSGDTGIVRADVRHTYTGNTTLAFGTTYVDSSLELATTGGPLGNKSLIAANTLLMTGGTLSYLGGSVDYSGRFSTAGSQQWQINTGASSVAFSSSLQGNSSLSLLGGNLSLSSDSRFSSFTGGVNLVGGTLILDAPVTYVGLTPTFSPIGVSGTITFTGGTLRYTSSNSFDYSARFSTNAGQQWKIDTNGESVVFASSLTSTGGSLLCLGGGTLNLTAANAYNSGTTLSAGTLKCSNVQSLGTGGLAQANNTTLHVTATGGKLTIQGAHTNTGTGSRTIRIGA